MQAEFLKDISLESEATETCKTSPNSQHGCSPLASLVSPQVSLESEKGRQMTVGSGRRLLPLLKESSPLGYVLKTLLESSVWNNPLCRLTWKATGILSKRRFDVKVIFGPLSPEKLNSSFAILSRQSKNSDMRSLPLLFQLAVSEHGTGDTGSGLWATPRAYSHGPDSNRQGLTTLDVQVRNLYPTPTAGEHTQNRSASPNAKVRATLVGMARYGLFPTPDARDANAEGFEAGKRRLKKHSTCGLQTAVRLDYPTPTASGQLNPTWVEWLMGFPLGWTDLEDSETQLSRK